MEMIQKIKNINVEKISSVLKLGHINHRTQLFLSPEQKYSIINEQGRDQCEAHIMCFKNHSSHQQLHDEFHDKFIKFC